MQKQKNIFGVSRLVWQQAGPSIAPGGASSTVAQERHERAQETPGEALSGLMSLTTDQATAEISERTGITLTDSSVGRGERLEEVFSKLAKSFDDLGAQWDRFLGLLAPFGIGQEETESRLWEPAGAKEDVKEDQPAQASISADYEQSRLQWEKRKAEGRNFGWKDWNHAKNIERKLTAHPDWMQYCEEAASHYGMPLLANTIVAFIEMESGWNPTVKNPTSSALGLGQAMFSTQKQYWKEKRAFWSNKHGISYAELNPSNSRDPATIDIFTNPEIAIDLVAWHATNAIRAVQNSPYKIDPSDPDWVVNLYLTHNSGIGGYKAVRRYLDNPTKENLDKLPGFLKKKVGENLEYDPSRYQYAQRVASIAAAYDSLKTEKK